MTTTIEAYSSLMERCDRCGAAGQACVLVNDVELTFCDHDYRKHAEKLRDFPTVILETSVHFVPALV